MAGSKKDFTKMKTGRAGSKVQANIDTSTGRKGQQATATPEEKAERAAGLKTQGRKGCKLTRINMGFTPDNHEFIKILAKATGRTMTQLTNDIITAYRNEHPEFMEKAAGFLDLINSQKWAEKD